MKRCQMLWKVCSVPAQVLICREGANETTSKAQNKPRILLHVRYPSFCETVLMHGGDDAFSYSPAGVIDSLVSVGHKEIVKVPKMLRYNARCGALTLAVTPRLHPSITAPACTMK